MKTKFDADAEIAKIEQSQQTLREKLKAMGGAGGRIDQRHSAIIRNVRAITSLLESALPVTAVTLWAIGVVSFQICIVLLVFFIAMRRS